MKKLILGACALMALTVASCGKCDADKEACAANDSISVAYGEFAGSMMQNEFGQYAGDDQALRNDFVRGFQLVFGQKDSDRNERIGMQVALNMLSELDQLEQQGVTIDKAKAVAAFKKAFLADSVSPTDVQMRMASFRRMMEAATEQARAAKEAEKAQAPEAKDNEAAAAKAIENLKADNNNVQTLPSGLVYVVEAEGTGDKPTEDATVVVNYTGKHLNGEVFDSTDGRGPATFNLQGVVPGFREGLMQLAKGGKATLYIPGNIGYGVNGQPQAGIGPNEMLVFDVELIDINPAK